MVSAIFHKLKHGELVLIKVEYCRLFPVNLILRNHTIGCLNHNPMCYSRISSQTQSLCNHRYSWGGRKCNILRVYSYSVAPGLLSYSKGIMDLNTTQNTCTDWYLFIWVPIQFAQFVQIWTIWTTLTISSLYWASRMVSSPVANSASFF